jgi:precorrin-2 dehydrogenase / sirohydrochlorin ferrochelatase
VRHAYPLLLDVSDRLVVIIGGGAVAARKAQGVLAAGGRHVKCIAVQFHAEMPAAVERVVGAFEPEQLDGAGLVFAATNDPAVNDAVVYEAHRRGLLVNRADGDEENPGDFTTPALWRSDAMMITVSAAGNPALAAAVRDDLAEKIDLLHAQMAEAMKVLRPMVLRSGIEIGRRREVLRALAGAEAMEVLGDGGVEGVVEWMKKTWPELGK